MLSAIETTTIHMQRGAEDVGLVSELRQVFDELKMDEEAAKMWYPRLFELQQILEQEVQLFNEQIEQG